jgi:hypothetical protein
MLTAQLAQPPATNHTMVGLPRKEAIVAVAPDGVVNVPSGANVVEADADRCDDAAGCVVVLVAPLPVPASA